MIETPERRGTDSVKWGIYGNDVIPLWVADMDFTSPPEVMDVLRKRVDHGVFGYGLESRSFKDLLIERMQALYNWTITRQDILFIPGVIAGFNLVCQAVTKAGESVLLPTPVYPPFFSVPGNAKARGVFNEVQLDAKGEYAVDLGAFERSIQPDTRCFMLCNPHNPIGRVYSRAELEGIAEICLKHQLVICSDEIHCDLVYSGYKHTPIASINPEIAARTVTLVAPSKTYNIAGLECAVIICQDQDLRMKIDQTRRGLMAGVNILGMLAGEAAYRHGEKWLQDVLCLLESNRDFLLRYFSENIPQIKLVKPQATYLAWLDCRELSLSVPPSQFFLERAGVALNNGLDFGDPGKGFVRLNFGCSKSTLVTALKRMKTAVDSR